MKNLFIAMITIVAFTSCNHSEKNTKESSIKQTQTVSSSGQVVFKTLNNVDGVMAGMMIQHFKQLKNGDKNPLPVSIWISKDVIHDMVLLLNSELAQQLAMGRIDTTDGIRVYFAADTTSNIYPLKTSILLVSTKYNGPSTEPILSCPSGNLHLDYYEHASNAKLFALANYGESCNDGPKCAGSVLYTTSTAPGVDPNCPTLPHYIRRDTAEHMVQRFKNHVINTCSEWFDLCFLQTLDKEKALNGIHIYFATNPEDKDNKYISRRDAFVITSTWKNPQTGVTEDYFDCKSAADFKANFIKSHPGITNPDYFFDPAKDKGELCPNSCN